jgi:dTDP-4-dehydrorhamnose 3,5-epimerase
MKFIETPLQGAYIIELEPIVDDRGYFSRTFCVNELAGIGVDFRVVQCSTSFNKTAGILRGLCYQAEPAAETKLVRCVNGAIYDVMVDLRPDSKTYLQHFGIKLSSAKPFAVLIPVNFAHGFLTLEPDTEVFYMMDEFFAPESERGLRYNDPALDIQWPSPVQFVAEKDLNWPLIKTSAN